MPRLELHLRAACARSNPGTAAPCAACFVASIQGLFPAWPATLPRAPSPDNRSLPRAQSRAAFALLGSAPRQRVLPDGHNNCGPSTWNGRPLKQRTLPPDEIFLPTARAASPFFQDRPADTLSSKLRVFLS